MVLGNLGSFSPTGNPGSSLVSKSVEDYGVGCTPEPGVKFRDIDSGLQVQAVVGVGWHKRSRTRLGGSEIRSRLDKPKDWFLIAPTDLMSSLPQTSNV